MQPQRSQSGVCVCTPWVGLSSCVQQEGSSSLAVIVLRFPSLLFLSATYKQRLSFRESNRNELTRSSPRKQTREDLRENKIRQTGRREITGLIPRGYSRLNLPH